MAKNELAANNGTNLTVSYKTSINEEINLNYEVVRDLIAKGNEFITNAEIELFMNICKYQKSNPFVGESYLVKYDEKKPAQNVTGLGYFERIADEHPKYDGNENGIIVKNNKGEIVEREGCVRFDGEVLLGGWCKVYRTDRSRPTVVKINYQEFNKQQATWKAMPAVMINKCAKVAALRGAFPASFRNCYIKEELDNEENHILAVEVDSIKEKEKIYDFDDDKKAEDVVLIEKEQPKKVEKPKKEDKKAELVEEVEEVVVENQETKEEEVVENYVEDDFDELF